MGHEAGMRRLRLAVRCALVLLVGAASAAFSFDQLFVPKKELWPAWQVAGTRQAPVVDHRPWDDWLQKYHRLSDDGIARIAYGAVTPGDRQALADYVDDLQGVPIRQYPRPVQWAYWVNLYNARTVLLILEHDGVDSIRDIKISPGLFKAGPWDKKLLTVEGEKLSLNDVEHRILRPIWDDPRIHYAVNCAAVGCPNLQPVAFTPENTERLLDAAARAYVNHPRGVRIDGGELYTSSIYRWFRADFGRNSRDVIAHLRRYAEPPLAEQLDTLTYIKGDFYDWALNRAPL